MAPCIAGMLCDRQTCYRGNCSDFGACIVGEGIDKKVAICDYIDTPVGDGHHVEVGVLAINEVGVRPPDAGEELPVHGELGQAGVVVAEAAVDPSLSEVAVQCVHLPPLVHRAH